MYISSALKTPFTSGASRLMGPPETRSILAFNLQSSGNFSSMMGRTENNSLTHLTSGNPCLDFFFQVVPDTPPATVAALLSSAWAHDPLTSLKLVCNLRGVGGTGKSDRLGFYTSALWLHEHHPETLAANVGIIARFGDMKDLLEILSLLHRRSPGATVYRSLHDRVADLFANELSSGLERLKCSETPIELAAKWCPSLYSSLRRWTQMFESIARRMFPRESDPAYEHIPEEHYACRIKDRLHKEVLVPLRRALDVLEVYMRTGNWGLIPDDRVKSVLGEKTYMSLLLKRDRERFREFLDGVKKGTVKVSTGALLPHQISAFYDSSFVDIDYGCRYSRRSIKKVLWRKTRRYREYMERPYGDCYYYDRYYESDGGVAKASELQWRRMVEEMLEAGKLRNCIAVCDVSWSMSGTPADVCAAMGLLLSELGEEPWKGKVITFSEKPRLHNIKGVRLKRKLGFTKRTELGGMSDLQKVFDQMLEVAAKGKLAPEEMIKRVFVFSDMEFHGASADEWETDYEAICRKFEAAGYGSCVPEIVFWKLRESWSIPVTSKQKGVALVSGFSKNLMKLFLKGEEEESFDPESIMEKALSGEEYGQLVVVD